jgi:hypothetical protein
VNVLHHMVEAVRPGGTILDLQVIRPNPRVEAGDDLICEIDGEPLFAQADAATAAVDGMIGTGRLIEDAVDDHDVRKHFSDGPDLIDDLKDKGRPLPEGAIQDLMTITRPLVIRERCRLRKLVVS